MKINELIEELRKVTDQEVEVKFFWSGKDDTRLEISSIYSSDDEILIELDEEEA